MVAAPNDVGADLVVRHLADRDMDVHRIDPNDLARPGVLRMTGMADGEPLRFTVDDGHRTTLSASIVSVFWWHPEHPAEWAQTESRTILESFLYGLSDVLWVNHPHRSLAARPGPVQLKTARDLGFRTPDALFTNEPDKAAVFAEECGGQVVCKTLVGHPDRFVQARLVSTQEIRDSWENIQRGVHYFQQPIAKTHDIRLTVIGDRMFPCKITADGLDWRAVPEDEQHYEAAPITLPMAKKVTALMRRLDLAYAALDFAVDHNGTWWFLEANPSGQFGFVEVTTGMVISRAIADHLTQAAMATRVFTPDGGHRASSGPATRRRKVAGA
jgi:hypothetical protein